jgi:adenine-specific DNA-methyltransferase
MNPESLELRSDDITEHKFRALLALFPEIETEGHKIDFDRLKQSLGHPIEVGKERFNINWPGKAECYKAIQTPSIGALLPCREESLNFDSTQNVIIEGDNLEVLKLLQKSYLGKIKMIYIDPPYNTGNDFIYPDDFSESLQTYLQYTGQKDMEGRSFCTNTEASGRFHSRWLSMMYSRLYLSRNLLSDDGAMFISIDDHEAHNLRRICDEIFGEENFICTFIWEKRYSPPPDTKDVGYVHENILLYRKTPNFRMGLLPLAEEQKARYKNPDNDPRGDWKPMDYTCRYTKAERPNLYYPITNPHTGKRVWPKKTRVWAFSQDVHRKNEEENRIWWGTTGKAKVPALKNFLSEIKQGMMPMTLLKHDVVGNTDEATKELRQIIPGLKYTPKPIRLIKHLAIIANLSPSDIVLDFFAGSGTTAAAILALNKDSTTHLKFILVQLPEPTGDANLSTIAEIMKARVRGVIRLIMPKKAGSSGAQHLVPQDLGFRVFKLAESNFKPWNAEVSHKAGEIEKQLELHVHHIRDARTTEDILYEILLKSGFSLTVPIAKTKLAGKTVYSVAENALLICLDRDLTMEAIRAMAEKKPERVVCLDVGFAGKDQLKTNAVQIFKAKGVTSFKTV